MGWKKHTFKASKIKAKKLFRLKKIEDPIMKENKPIRVLCSYPLRKRLKHLKIDLIALHRSNRKKSKTQDGRKLRRYRKSWKVERTFAWLGNFRRLVVRYEREIKMYRAFFHLACLIIVLNRF